MTTRHYSSTAAPTSLQAAITSTDTAISVASASGLPAVPFILCLDMGTAAQELVKVTTVAGQALTIERGFDSTTATDHDAGATVTHTHAAVDFRDSRNHEAASDSVHGVDGDVVGTTDTQVLTNKDLSDSTNSFPSSLTTDTELAAHTDLTAGVHGVTGTVVGTTDEQALTNKDLSDDSNTFPDLSAFLPAPKVVGNGQKDKSHSSYPDINGAKLGSVTVIWGTSYGGAAFNGQGGAISATNIGGITDSDYVPPRPVPIYWYSKRDASGTGYIDASGTVYLVQGMAAGGTNGNDWYIGDAEAIYFSAIYHLS